MDRRHFLQSAGMAATLASPLVSSLARAADRPPVFAPTPANGWRTFEGVTRVEILKPEGASRVWLPLPSVFEPEWIRPLGNLWETNADAAKVAADPVYGSQMLTAEWKAGAAPVLELASRFAARDRAVDLSRPARVVPLTAEERALWTASTEFLPTDGLVRETALQVTQGARTDEAKARALYTWICDHTERNSATRGCGVGDIRGMLEAGNLSGKCADLNALYVGMARSLGIPARDVYGIRVSDSRYGYKSLGKSGAISKAQHCRAEVWLAGHGWVPVDPADVRKVILEEPPGKLSRDDAKVKAVAARLFGSWEMSWLPYLMYPQAETAAGRLDSLDPDAFRYTLTAREITA